MDQRTLDSEYGKLKEACLESIDNKESMLWEVCYRWWSVYRVLNDQLSGAADLQEKHAIVKTFANFQKEFIKELNVEYTQQGVDMEKVAPLDDRFDEFPKHMQDIILVMRMQRARFIDNIKEIKSKKSGRGSEVTRKLQHKKRKWLKT